MGVNERGPESQAQRWLFMPSQGAPLGIAAQGAHPSGSAPPAAAAQPPHSALDSWVPAALLDRRPPPCRIWARKRTLARREERDPGRSGARGQRAPEDSGGPEAQSLARPPAPGRPEEGAAMALDSLGVSVKSRVSAFEVQQEPQGCGCCMLPDSRDPRRPRQRGCTSPAHSRDLSPAKTRETPKGRRKLNGRKKEVDKTLVSLLLVLHSGTNSSMIAIDNKIEQAMDLVKSHLMFAVREEVEVLREQIKELSDRNALLEQENALLRSLASAEQLSRFQAQLHANAKPPSSGAA